MLNLPGWTEVMRRMLGPDEGPWEVEWVCGRDEQGELLRSRRRFQTLDQAEFFKDHHCGMSMIEMMKLME